MEYVVSKNCNLTQVGGLLDSRGYGIATTREIYLFNYDKYSLLLYIDHILFSPTM